MLAEARRSPAKTIIFAGLLSTLPRPIKFDHCPASVYALTGLCISSRLPTKQLTVVLNWCTFSPT